MRRRMLAAALACTLLAGCGPVRTEPVEQETPQAGAPVIAYVPLDDRPDNAERVVYLAESLGYELAMPERDLYRTRLDGQPPNENGTQYGDRGALYEWVAKQEAAGCDRYILSLDQLLSGGLVSSRAMTGENPVTLSSGETLVEAELLTAVIDLLAADENNRIWLLDTVMRLAATTGYGGFGLNEYNALRTYGMAPRPHLEGTDLTIGNIVADYPLGADGTPVPVEAEEPLPEGAVENYLASRERKLRLSDAMFQALEETADGQFRVLIGIDDSSEEDSIQKNEVAYLRAQLRQGDALLSGVDDLAFKAVTKLCLEEYGWEGAAVSVQYFGGTEDQPACAYDYQPLEAIVAEHFDFFDLTMAEPGGEELAMLVLTQPADPAAQETYINALVQCLNDNRAAGLPTILIDAGNGTYGTAFHKALTDQAELGWLLSYAGFLDMAIVTGTALSHGVARYAFLQHGEQTDATGICPDLGGQHSEGLLLQEHRAQRHSELCPERPVGQCRQLLDAGHRPGGHPGAAGGRHGSGRGPGDRKPGAEQLHLFPFLHPGVCRAGLGRRGADGIRLPLGPGLRDQHGDPAGGIHRASQGAIGNLL